LKIFIVCIRMERCPAHEQGPIQPDHYDPRLVKVPPLNVLGHPNRKSA